MSTAKYLFIAPAAPPSNAIRLSNWARPQVQCVGQKKQALNFVVG